MVPNADTLAKLVALSAEAKRQNPSLTSFTLTRIAFTGAYVNNDWFASSDVASHPFSADLLNDAKFPFGSLLMATRSMSILPPSATTQSAGKVFSGGSGTPTTVRLATLPTLTDQPPVNIPVPGPVSFGYNGITKWGAVPHVDTSITAVDKNVVSINIPGVIESSFTPWQVVSGDVCQGSVFSVPGSGGASGSIPAGRFAPIKPDLLGVITKSVKNWGSARFEESIPQYGYTVESFGPGLYHCAMDAIAGTSRVIVLFPDGQYGGAGSSLRFYVYGEGLDVVIDGRSYVTQPVNGQAQIVDSQLVLPFGAQIAGQAADARTAEYGTVSQGLFPLSLSSMMIKSMETTVTSDVTSAAYASSDHLAYYREISVTVSSYTGALRLADYMTLLTTGYKIWKTVDAATATKVSKSWGAIDTITYNVISGLIGPLSLTQTNAYREYGKSRAKACLTNNYLELAYNQEYSMKQVEAKLSALRGYSCLSYDLAAVGNNTSTGTVSNAIPVATLTLRSGTTTIYDIASTNGTHTLVDTASADSVSAMLTAVMPCTFAGDTTGLARFMATQGTGDINGVNTAASIDTNAVRVDFTQGQVPRVPTPAVISAMSVDSQVRFMAAQLTDYAMFNAGMPLLPAKYAGDSVFNIVYKYLSTVVTAP